MADFTDDQIGVMQQQTGLAPDFIKSQLAAEGHRVVPAAGAPAPAPVQAFPQASAATMPLDVQPVAPAQGQWFGGMGQQSAKVNAPVEGYVAPAPNQPNAGAAPPGAQTQRQAPIRATGLGMAPAQPSAQPAMLGSLSKARKLMDARETGLAKEYVAAEEARQASAQRLGEIENEVFGFHKQRLDQDAAKAAETAGLYNEVQASNQQAQMAEQAARAKEDEVIQAKSDQLLQKRQELANEKIKERSWGSRLGSAFAVALSGFGDAIVAASGKGRADAADTTMALVNAAIQRDVDEQLRQIAEKKGALTAEEQGIVDLRNTVGNDRAFRLLMQSQRQEAFAQRFEEIAAKGASETAKIAAKEAGPLFRQAAELNAQQGAAAAAEDARKRLREAADQRFGVELGFALPRPAGGKKPDEPLPEVTGLRRLRPDITSADRTKAQEVKAASSNVLGTIDQLISMASKGMTLSPDDRKTAKRRIGALKSQFNGVFGDGTAPNEAQLEALDDMFSNPTEANWGDARKQFEVFKQDAVDLTNAKLRTYNHVMDDAGAGSFTEE